MPEAMITVVGAGFAGVEAAWAAASKGVRVRLYEMRPGKQTPAHTTGWFAELVCSNSLKSKAPDSPAGQLKAEMEALGSIVLRTARAHEVPGGQALAVDRDKFGQAITDEVEAHPLIDVVREEFLPEHANPSPAQPLVVATGPLSSDPVSQWLAELTGRKHLYFYDAVSPTVEASSIDTTVAFAQSRYDKGGDDYLNCPFDRDEYQAFVQALVGAERVPIHAFESGGVRKEGDSGEGAFLEKIKYFAGCTPIEAIAEKGERSLAFGNFKPVGLTDPRTGRRPHAALQLRPENAEKTLYSLVACQNRLKWGEQKRVFRMVPGLERAEFVRYGVIHRNTYLEAPRCLLPDLQLRGYAGLFVAGQLTGVEGYVESAAMGILAGLHAAAMVQGTNLPHPPRATAYGGLLAHLQDATPREFAPMNINWGLFPEPEEPMRDKGRVRAFKIEQARTALNAWMA
ncbi:MAG: methylenetetrahydrofolate--tRNA-(uracil(54)-C(5))-methyltransferase (FADH(2)-oxidizing) TrmFO [Chthonomonadaceae bacterium]|nr:methylenetetrahydrofolate--tRNA-(uracil(54)-C(5))-methyltransferase (FADH(2)-oxidizing) TrmFO [Chthonomonadaceae bacterium]